MRAWWRQGKVNFMVRIISVIVVSGIVMMFTFNMVEWYGEKNAIPRFCKEPDLHVALVREILTKSNPVGDQAKRPYIVAAKLIFLIPQKDGEDVDAYIFRLQQKLAVECR